MDKINILKGILFAYGVIEVNDIVKIFKRYKIIINAREIEDIIINDESLSKYFDKLVGMPREGNFKKLIAIRNKVIEPDIAISIVCDCNLKRHKFNKNEILSYSKYGFNIYNKSLKEMINVFSKFFDISIYMKFFSNFLRIINLYDNCDDIMISSLYDIVKENNINIDGRKFVKLQNILLNCCYEYNTWKFLGNSFDEVQNYLNSKKSEYLTLEEINNIKDMEIKEFLLKKYYKNGKK